MKWSLLLTVGMVKAKEETNHWWLSIRQRKFSYNIWFGNPKSPCTYMS